MLPAAFDWSRAVVASRRNLPHIRQYGAVYFVTYRAADSVPADLVIRWREQLAFEESSTGNEQRKRELAARVEKYLDHPQGECLLAGDECRQVVVDNLLHGDGDRYVLDAYAVMPNHVHALVMPAPGQTLTRILADWKRYSTRVINRMCGRTGGLWASEAFDHILRDTAALSRFRAYIDANPGKVPPGHACSGRGSFGTVTGL